MAIDAKPRAKAQVFSLRTPLLSAGRGDQRLALTDLMEVRVKVYAEGGENALHTHLDQDHAFVVLQGEATFHDETGQETVVRKNQGISLPRGAYYWFKSTGNENLVMVRFAAYATERLPDGRVDLDGKPLPGNSEANKHIDGVPIPGRFFGD